MARQIVNTGSTANDNTGDTMRNAGTKINANFSEIYTILGGATVATTSMKFGENQIIAEGVSANDFETTLAFTDPTADRTITFPDATGTVQLTTATYTLTSPVLTTPQIQDTSSNHQYIFAPSELAADRTVTLPLLAGNDTFSFVGFTETLTNKTLTSPVLTTPKTILLHDTSGNETIKTPAASNAVNFLAVNNSATNADVIVASDGSDAAVDLALSTKGTGKIVLSKSLVLQHESLSGAGAADAGLPLTIVSNGGAFIVTLADGVQQGQMHKFINIGAGVCTITPANMLNGTSVTLARYAVAEFICVGSGLDWVLTSAATAGSTPAVTVVA